MGIMRLIESLPQLPEGEGRLWTHRTGGEHAPKFIGTERTYNPLRANELHTLSGDPVTPINGEELEDMLSGNTHEVIFVDRQDLPEDKSGPRGLVAGAIAVRDIPGRFEKVIKVTEIVVHPELRDRKIASYMLRRMTRSEHYGTGDPTELVIDGSVYELEDWFTDKLSTAGFSHTTPDGSPALWLPGSPLNVRYDVDIDNPSVVKGLLGNMPSEWNGYVDLYPETDPQTQVFRGGQLLGLSRSVEGSARYDEGTHERVEDFKLYDAGNEKLDEVVGLSRVEALTALLNQYHLLDQK
jgi:hypothetical protein